VQGTSRFIVFVAMVLLTIVSIWTTYISLTDSILPEPKLPIPLPSGIVWQCSVFALALSVAIGLMLFALKAAIIDEQKSLGIGGILGLIVVGFISITFNMDVLYRTADKEFYTRYANDEMLRVYENHLSEAERVLTTKRDALRKQVATQTAELESEVEGIRQSPAGYGTRAKEEEYKLRIMESGAEVELETLDQALASKEKADALILATHPQTIEEVQQFQNDLRVLVRDVAAQAGLPLPHPVKLESPIFAVFAKLFDFKNVGMKEIFFLLIALFLDVGDIIGYSLVPKGKKQPARRLPHFTPVYDPTEGPRNRPEFVPSWDLIAAKGEDGEAGAGEQKGDDFFGESTIARLPNAEQGRPPRSFRIDRR
jgi:hypothetical protein